MQPLNLEQMATDLKAAQVKFIAAAKELRCPVSIVAFLILGGLIVAAGSCLCLMLPGVNVIRDVILPGVLPASIAFVLSIPFIVKSVKLSAIKTEIYEKNVYPLVRQILDAAFIEELPGARGRLVDQALDRRIDPKKDFKNLHEQMVKFLLWKGYKTLREFLAIDIKNLREANPKLFDRYDPDRDKPLDENCNLSKMLLAKWKRAGDPPLRAILANNFRIAFLAPEDIQKVMRAIDGRWPLDRAVFDVALDQTSGLEAALLQKLGGLKISEILIGEHPLGDKITPDEWEQVCAAIERKWPPALKNVGELNTRIETLFPGLLPPGKSAEVGHPTLRQFLRGEVQLWNMRPAEAEEVVKAAQEKWPSQVRSAIVRKWRVVFVESYILTLDNPRHYQDYFRPLLMQVLKEYGEEKKKKKPERPEKFYTVRNKAIGGALGNLLRPEHKKRD